MRIIPIAAAALALWGVAASAQTMPGPYSSSIPVQSTTRVPVNRDVINPLTEGLLSRIRGMAVYGSDEVKIGHVATVLIDPRTRRIDRLVVAAGGILGFGSHPVAIAVNQFVWDAYIRAFRLPATLSCPNARADVRDYQKTGLLQSQNDIIAKFGQIWH